MDMETFAQRVEALRPRLYRTAFCYMGGEAMALDVLDEAVYRGLKSLKKLRQPEYFDTWITRILINECHNELRRGKRFVPLDDVPEGTAEDFDSLPLKEALSKLPQPLRDVVILRYFAGYTLAETARALDIPPGTAATRHRRALELLRLELREEVAE